jgi:hypothetical protein
VENLDGHSPSGIAGTGPSSGPPALKSSSRSSSSSVGLSGELTSRGSSIGLGPESLGLPEIGLRWASGLVCPVLLVWTGTRSGVLALLGGYGVIDVAGRI